MVSSPDPKKSVSLVIDVQMKMVTEEREMEEVSHARAKDEGIQNPFQESGKVQTRGTR